MTDEQIRVAVAEACGWEGDKHPGGDYHWHKKGLPAAYYDDLPNYPNDLNAMHEAENGLGAYEDTYAEELIRVCDRDEDARVGSFHIINATARQRAEAFLRTLGKWSE